MSGIYDQLEQATRRAQRPREEDEEERPRFWRRRGNRGFVLTADPPVGRPGPFSGQGRPLMSLAERQAEQARMARRRRRQRRLQAARRRGALPLAPLAAPAGPAPPPAGGMVAFALRPPPPPVPAAAPAGPAPVVPGGAMAPAPGPLPPDTIRKVRFLESGREYIVSPPESAQVAKLWSFFQSDARGRWNGRPYHVDHRLGDTLILAATRPVDQSRSRRTGCRILAEYGTEEEDCHVQEVDAPGIVGLVQHLWDLAEAHGHQDRVSGFRLTVIERATGFVFLESDVLDVPAEGGLRALNLLSLIDHLVSVWIEMDDPSPRAVQRRAGSWENEFQALFDQCTFRMEFWTEGRGGVGQSMGSTKILKKRWQAYSPASEQGNCFFACLDHLKIGPVNPAEIREKYGWADQFLGVSQIIPFLRDMSLNYRIRVMYAEDRDDVIHQWISSDVGNDGKFQVDLLYYRAHYYVNIGPVTLLPVCKLCHSVHPVGQACQATRVRYWQRKQDRAATASVSTAYYDLETRGDVEHAIVSYEREPWCLTPGQPMVLLPTRRVTYRQVAVECSVYEAGKEPIEFLGKDCLAQLFAWLKANPTLLKLLAHNGARFDSLLIREYAVEQGWAIENLIQANGRLLSMTIQGVEFGCTFRFLPKSLKSLGKDFHCEEQKMVDIPEEHQQEGLRTMDDLLLYHRADWTPEQYLEWIGQEESWKSIYLEYCGLDSKVLGNVWTQFRESMKALFTAMYADGRRFRGKHPSTVIDAFITLPQMVYAHWKFQTKLMAKIQHIGDSSVTLPRVLYDFYRQFIVGGRSQQRVGYYQEELLYIDVVSLYPCAQSIYPFPTRSLPEVYVTDFHPDMLGLYCIRNLAWPEAWQSFNPFPARDSKGHKLHWDLPQVTRPLLVTSVDLLMAEEVGATYEVVWGWCWLRTWNPFHEFMNHFLRVKKGEDLKPPEERNHALRQASKLCLVSLYGKLAQSPPKYQYEEFDEEKCQDWERRGPPQRKKEMREYQRYMSYTMGEWEVVSRIQSGGRTRIFRRLTFAEKEKMNYHPAQYGVFTLAWSRYHMFQYAKRLCNDKGVPEIYGSETDSLIVPYHYKDRLQPSATASYSFEEFTAQAPYHNMGSWKRFWDQHQEGLFCLGSEIGNVVDEIASQGLGKVEAAILVQPKTYALKLVDRQEGAEPSIHWHMRWKGIPVKTRDGKPIITLAHYGSVLRDGGVSFVKLTQFLRLADKEDQLPGVAVAELAKTIVRPRLSEDQERVIELQTRSLERVAQPQEYLEHLTCLQRTRTSQREFGRMRAIMADDGRPEDTLIQDRFRQYWQEYREQAADFAENPEARRRWDRQQFDTWEERWTHALALEQSEADRRHRLGIEDATDEEEDSQYDVAEEEEDVLAPCLFVEDMALEESA